MNVNILLMSLVIISFCMYQNQYNSRMDNNSVEALILDAEDKWQIKLKNNVSHNAKLGKTLFVHPLLTIISLSINHKQKYFIYTPEIIDADLFRRLRVRLRFKARE